MHRGQLNHICTEIKIDYSLEIGFEIIHFYKQNGIVRNEREHHTCISIITLVQTLSNLEMIMMVNDDDSQ